MIQRTNRAQIRSHGPQRSWPVMAFLIVSFALSVAAPALRAGPLEDRFFALFRALEQVRSPALNRNQRASLLRPFVRPGPDREARLSRVLEQYDLTPEEWSALRTAGGLGLLGVERYENGTRAAVRYELTTRNVLVHSWRPLVFERIEQPRTFDGLSEWESFDGVWYYDVSGL